MDANVLLSLYKVQASTSKLYLDSLHSRVEQLWITHQAAAEFHRHVHFVRGEQTADHKKRIQSIDSFLEEIRKTQKKSRLQESELQRKAVESLLAFKDGLESELDAINKETNHQAPDALLARIAALFENRVGTEPSKTDLGVLHKQADERFADQIPPGFKDANKEGDQKYGDFVLWRQLMDHAAKECRDIIFVTDDDKADWWLKNDSKKSIAPRPELIQEFRSETSQDVLILNSSQFYYQLVPATDDAQHSQQVIAARQDMEAVVAEAHAISNKDVLETMLRRVELHHPVGVTPLSLATARQYLEERIAWGTPLDDVAMEIATQAAVRADHAQITSEVATLEQRAAAIEHHMMTLPSTSGDVEMLRQELEAVRSMICIKVDRQHQLEPYARHYAV
ncbi:PIN domain-containing protein [Paenarthrobacter aromaticivorans]|uniref:PIN domain-containing protein n=1 Tax=Paenarthrobacter aromaticivorans TaxID=2849150 RepID=UPI003A7FC35E